MKLEHIENKINIFTIDSLQGSVTHCQLDSVGTETRTLTLEHVFKSVQCGHKSHFPQFIRVMKKDPLNSSGSHL